MAENFFDYDTPHSHAKRKLVHKVVCSVIPRHLNNLSTFRADKFAMKYVDAFAGTGSFGRDPKVMSFGHKQECEFCTECDLCRECKICRTGTPILALTVTLEHMENLTRAKNTKYELYKTRLTRLNTVEFIFNDANRDYIVALYKKISACFHSLNWEETNVDSSSFSNCYKAVEYEGPFLSVRQSIRIYFTFYEFKDMTFLAEFQTQPQPQLQAQALFQFQTPLFTLIDPFNVTQIPMSVVRQLIGEHKDVLINLMVGQLDRLVLSKLD
jgi:hypothetical protein